MIKKYDFESIPSEVLSLKGLFKYLSSPETAKSSMGRPSLLLMKPRTEKAIRPAVKEVIPLTTGTKKASFRQLLWYLWNKVKLNKKKIMQTTIYVYYLVYKH